MAYHAPRHTVRRGFIALMFGICQGGGALKWRRIAGAFALLILAFALLLVGTGPPPASAQTPDGIDYDLDDDGLIEIRNLAQLNAIRESESGKGIIIPVGSSGTPQQRERDRKFKLAFPNPIQAVYTSGLSYDVPPMGCGYGAPDVAFDGLCYGYELAADLDFDTNGDGEITAADDNFDHNGDGEITAEDAISWNNGTGWVPVPQLTSSFQGNGYTISNMMINAASTANDEFLVGMFERMGGGSTNNLPLVTDGLRLVDVNIRADSQPTGAGPYDLSVGAIAGEMPNRAVLRNSSATGKIVVTASDGAPIVAGGLVGYINDRATIAASWADVDITATGAGAAPSQDLVGGLVGQQIRPSVSVRRGHVVASYATGEVSSRRAGRTNTNVDPSAVGGLVARAYNGAVTASYAAGAVTNEQKQIRIRHLGGLAGRFNADHITASYWDVDASDLDDDGDDNPPEGKSAAELQRPTGYTGIYAGWNVDVDNADGDYDLTTGVDDPWDFGTASDYPALKGPVRFDTGADLTFYSGQEAAPGCRLARLIRGALTPVGAADAGGVICRWRQIVLGDDPILEWTSPPDGDNPAFTAPTGLTEAITLTFAVTVTAADRGAFIATTLRNVDLYSSDAAVITDLVRVTINPAQPNELISLVVNAGGNGRPLTPAFASSRRSFDTYVGAYTGRAEIAMTPAEDGAAISFNGDDPAVGDRTETVSLAEGHNRFTITVTPPEAEAPAEGDDAAVDDAEPLEPVTYHLNIRRQRTPKLAFDPPHYLLMNEGETATYTVELDTRWLGAEVIINISSDNPDITVSPDTVSISQYDWSERTIEVTAAKDADGDDDYATIRHIANGGHYNNVGGRLRVEVSDDDIVPTPTPAPTPHAYAGAYSDTDAGANPAAGGIVRPDYGAGAGWADGNHHAGGGRAAGGIGIAAVPADAGFDDYLCADDPRAAAVVGQVRVGDDAGGAGGYYADGGRGAGRRLGALPAGAIGPGIRSRRPSLDAGALRRHRLERAAGGGAPHYRGMRPQHIQRRIRGGVHNAPAGAAVGSNGHARQYPRHHSPALDAGQRCHAALGCRHQAVGFGCRRFQQPNLDGGIGRRYAHGVRAG